MFYLINMYEYKHVLVIYMSVLLFCFSKSGSMRTFLEQSVCGSRVVAPVPSPIPPSDWCRGEEQLSSSGGLQHKQEGGRPEILAGAKGTVAFPGGKRRMTICPPAGLFTACLTAPALRDRCARQDRLGLGFHGKGCLGEFGIVCCCLNTAADQTEGPEKSQSVSHGEGSCCIRCYCVFSSFTQMLTLFPKNYELHQEIGFLCPPVVQR